MENYKNKILHYKKKKTTQIPLEIHDNNEIVHDPKSISNAFNDYFVNVGYSLTNCIANAADCTFTETSFIIKNHINSFFLRPISGFEVLNHINGLKCTKSAGKYGIPIKCIKLAAKVISPIVNNIYNSCIMNGSYPDILKIA